MRNLNYDLKRICDRNRDGSYATQRDRRRALDLMANHLADMGFGQMSAGSLNPKHVAALVERYKLEGLGAGTIKNRLAEIRWWAEKVGKQNVISKDNGYYD